MDITVATKAAKPGDAVLRIPEHLCVTLDRVFQDESVAELLTTNKLSEIACLTLYLAYEKIRRKDSPIYPYIKELDRQGARGPQGAKSPLLWEPGQVDNYLAGSPVIAQVKERLAGIEREYKELDTVWYMSGSLFNNYSLAHGFEPPTEQFSLEVFRQAFAAVSSCVVHLQGVPLSRRFALVPLGPPFLTYSSTCQALLKYDPERKEVQLAVDRDVAPGEPIVAWCGPQPNSRLLINYGVVDPNNPHDKLPLSITIPNADPLYRLKMSTLAEQSLSTQQAFQLSCQKMPLPEQLVPYLRLVSASTEEEIKKVRFGEDAVPVSTANERLVLAQLIHFLKTRLAGYKTTIEEDDCIIADPTSGPRRTVAARLLKIEKTILQNAMSAVMIRPGAEDAAEAPLQDWPVRIM